MIHIHCDIKDIDYLLSNSIDIKHVSNIIFNLSKKCEYFNRQMFSEKSEWTLYYRNCNNDKELQKELLIKNTKLFNILILNIFSLFNETSRTIIRYNNLFIFTMEFIKVYSIIKESFSFNYCNIKDKYLQSSLYS